MSCSKYAHDLKKDHFGNREKTCIRCGDKSKGEVLDDELKVLVARYLYEDYFRDAEYLPTGCCGGCRLFLQSQGKLDMKLIFKTNINCHL